MQEDVIMADSKIEAYLGYLKDLGYKESTLENKRKFLGQFLKMFPAEEDWQHCASLKLFLDEKRKQGACKAYLYLLEGTVRKFLIFEGKKEPEQRNASWQPFSWWEIQLKNFLDFFYHHHGVAKSTIRNYRFMLTQLIRWLERNGMVNADKLNSEMVMKFVFEKGQNYSKESLKQLNGALRQFFRYLYQKEVLSKDLSGMMMSPRNYTEQRIPLYFTEAQLKILLKSLNLKTPRGMRDFTILVLLIQYGLRTKEVVDLCLDDINWTEGTLLIKARKNQEDLLLPLTQEVTDLLRVYINSYRIQSDSPQVFLRVKAPIRKLSLTRLHNMVVERLREAGINGNPRQFRHTFAKRLMEQGEPLPVIQQFLGHRSINSTRIYAKVNIEQLREVAFNDSEQWVKENEKLSKSRCL